MITNLTNQSSSPAKHAGWTLRIKRASPLISNVSLSMKSRVILFIVVLGCIICSCSTNTKTTFWFQDDRMMESVTKTLTQKGIWFKPKPKRVIEIYESDVALVKQLSNEVVQNIIPQDRSINVNKYDQPRILEALHKAGIKYHLVIFGDNIFPSNAEYVDISPQFIVFEEGFETKGFEVINDYYHVAIPE